MLAGLAGYFVPEQVQDEDSAKPENCEEDLKDDIDRLIHHEDVWISSNPVGYDKPDGDGWHHFMTNFMAHMKPCL